MKAALTNQIKHNLKFLVEIYETESQFEKIKQVVHDNTDLWDFNAIILPILNIYPDFCFNTIKKVVTAKLRNGRGRHILNGFSFSEFLTNLYFSLSRQNFQA